MQLKEINQKISTGDLKDAEAGLRNQNRTFQNNKRKSDQRVENI